MSEIKHGKAQSIVALNWNNKLMNRLVVLEGDELRNERGFVE